MLRSVVAFLLGVFFELSYLVWIFCAERGNPYAAAGASMLVGALSLAGIQAAAKGGRMRAGALVLGYGAGSFLAATARARGWV